MKFKDSHNLSDNDILIAQMFNPDDTKDTIFKRVDKALYQSKNTGKNKVTIS